MIKICDSTREASEDERERETEGDGLESAGRQTDTIKSKEDGLLRSTLRYLRMRWRSGNLISKMLY